MERYVWAAVVVILGVLASGTILIVAGRSAELEQFATLAGQAAVGMVNLFVVWRATRNTEVRVDRKLDRQTDDLKRTINGASGQFPVTKPRE